LSNRRLFQIYLQLLSGEQVTAAELAEETGASKRTIYRDVQRLMESGLQIQGATGIGYRCANPGAAALLLSATRCARWSRGRTPCSRRATRRSSPGRARCSTRRASSFRHGAAEIRAQVIIGSMQAISIGGQDFGVTVQKALNRQRPTPRVSRAAKSRYEHAVAHHCHRWSKRRRKDDLCPRVPASRGGLSRLHQRRPDRRRVVTFPSGSCRGARGSFDAVRDQVPCRDRSKLRV